MKKAHIVVFIFLLVLGFTNLNAQAPDWHLAYHPWDETKFKTEVAELIKAGYYPLGFDLSPGETFTLLYNKKSPFQDSAQWSLIQHENAVKDPAKFNAEIAVQMKAGWLPVDLSLVKNDVFILYVPTKQKLSSFQVHQADLGDTTAIQKIMQGAISNSFTPMGLANDGKNLFILFVKFEQALKGSVALRPVPNDGQSFLLALQEAGRTNLIPWGLTYTKDTVYFLLYKDK